MVADALVVAADGGGFSFAVCHEFLAGVGDVVCAGHHCFGDQKTPGPVRPIHLHDGRLARTDRGRETPRSANLRQSTGTTRKIQLAAIDRQGMGTVRIGNSAVSAHPP